jgi:hypothetical protein
MLKNLIERAKEKLKLRQSPIFFLNRPKTKKMFKNVKVVEFQSLYNQILIQMWDEGLLPESEKEDIEKLKLSHTDLYRYHFHSYFAGLYKRGLDSGEFALSYASSFHDNLIKTALNDIIFIDSEKIYCVNLSPIILDQLKDLNIDYKIINLEYLWIESRRKFVYIKNGKVVFKGLPEEIEETRSFIIEHSRRDKLNLLIE